MELIAGGEIPGFCAGRGVQPASAERVSIRDTGSGYASASEVVRAALRLVDEQDCLRAAKLEQLRDDIRQGVNSAPSKAWNAEDPKREGRARASSPGLGYSVAYSS